MRRPVSRLVGKGMPTSQTVRIPAPIGGLNLRDPRGSVPITEATFMLGFFPSREGLLLTKGSNTRNTGVFGIESLMVYTAGDGDETLFAAAGTAIYDATATGAIGSSVVSGLSNARWQHVNFTNSSGTAYLCCFNGEDSPRYWNGASWLTITGASTPAITGLTTSTIISATVHQRRMWLVQVDSLKLWYLPADSVGGEAKALDLGGIATKGGYIMAAESWTVDGGDGLDDYLVCITSEGQLIAYRGIDPSSASTWQHVGTWDIAEPVGRRCLYQYKGDVLIVTTTGIASAARIFSGDTATSGMITDKITGAYANAFTTVGASPGWQLLYYAKADMLIWSPPGYFMYAMNTISGAWSGWLLFGATCWALLNGEPVYADILSIKTYWDGHTNDGEPIVGSISQGFSDFGLPGIMKKAKLGRAIIYAPDGGDVVVSAFENYDASLSAPAPSSSMLATIGATNGLTQWFQMQAAGVSLAVYFGVEASNLVNYSGAYITFESGGTLGPAQIS